MVNTKVGGKMGFCINIVILNTVNYMVNTEDETGEDLDDMVSLIKRTRATIGLTNIMTPYPGTEIAEKRGGIPPDDYKHLCMVDYTEFVAFLENRWRFAGHSIPLEDAARQINTALRMSYPFRLLGFFDYFFGPKHILLILRSAKRRAYLKRYRQLFRKRIRRLIAEGFKLIRDKIRFDRISGDEKQAVYSM